MTIENLVHDDLDSYVGNRSILIAELRRVLLELERRGAITSAKAIMAETALGMSRCEHEAARTTYLASALGIHAKNLETSRAPWLGKQEWIQVTFLAALLGFLVFTWTVGKNGGLDIKPAWDFVRLYFNFR